MPADSVKIILDALLKVANQKKGQAMMAGIWNENIEEAYLI